MVNLKSREPSWRDYKLAIGVVSVLLLLSIFGGSWAGCSCTRIEAGHVGVSVKKCGGGGVDAKPIPTGYYWKEVFCEDIVQYPTSLQTLILTRSEKEGTANDDSITVNSSEGLPISVDVSMSFTLQPDMVPAIYTKYRTDVTTIAHNFMRQTIREGLQSEFSKYTAEKLYSGQKEVARANVEKFLTDRFSAEGFTVQQFTLNRVEVPKQVTDAINSKVAMTQQAQQAEAEVQKTKAEAQQTEARAEGMASAVRTNADAEAYANATIAKSITPELVQYKALDKWDGKLPTFSGGGAVPFIELPAAGK